LSIAQEYGHEFAAYRNDEKQPNEIQPACEEAEAHAPGEGRVEMINHPNRAETPKAMSTFRCPGGKIEASQAYRAAHLARGFTAEYLF
jgi:hypothetical protein